MDERALQQALHEIDLAREKLAGTVAGLAAAVASLPGIAHLDPNAVKSLVQELTGQPGVPEDASRAIETLISVAKSRDIR